MATRCGRGFFWLVGVVACFLLVGDGYGQTYRLKLKNGETFKMNYYYEKDNRIYIYRYGGYVGFPKSDVEKIDKNDTEEISEVRSPDLPTRTDLSAGTESEGKGRKTSPSTSTERVAPATSGARKTMEEREKNRLEQEKVRSDFEERDKKFKEQREEMDAQWKKKKEDLAQKKAEGQAKSAALKEKENKAKKIKDAEESLQIARNNADIACGNAVAPPPKSGTGEEAAGYIHAKNKAAKSCEYYKTRIPSSKNNWRKSGDRTSKPTQPFIEGKIRQLLKEE